jgi:hypothetical protein
MFQGHRRCLKVTCLGSLWDGTVFLGKRAENLKILIIIKFSFFDNYKSLHFLDCICVHIGVLAVRMRAFSILFGWLTLGFK